MSATVLVSSKAPTLTVAPVKHSVTISNRSQTLVVSADKPAIVVGGIVVHTIVGSATVPISRCIAAASISGNTVVALAGGLAVTANYADLSHAQCVYGIAVNGANAGDAVFVQTSGTMENPSWTMVPGLPVYFDTIGRLTHTVPTLGFIQRVGLATTATSIYISIDPPLIL